MGRSLHIFIIKIVIYIDNEWDKFPKKYICDIAALFGWLDLLKWAHSNDGVWDSKTCDNAAINGDLEIFKYLHENGCFWNISLYEIAALNGPWGLEFSQMGQRLMDSIECFSAPVYAAISGYCMGGGLDLALACHRRIASPNAIFGHREGALGLITGWGGTQRLPRLVGKGTALRMFVAAEKITASHGLRIGLIDAVADDPVQYCVNELGEGHPET